MKMAEIAAKLSVPGRTKSTWRRIPASCGFAGEYV